MKRRTAGLVSPARQARHSGDRGTPRLGTNASPGREWNVSADAGHKLTPRPATRDDPPEGTETRKDTSDGH